MLISGYHQPKMRDWAFMGQLWGFLTELFGS